MFEKISPDSEEYREEEEFLKEFDYHWSASWGSEILFKIDSNKRISETNSFLLEHGKITEADKNLEDAELSDFREKKLQESFHDWIDLGQDQQTKKSMIFTIQESMTEPSIADELRALLPHGKLPLSTKILDEIIQRAEKGEIFPVDLWEKMLRQNQKQLIEKTRVFRENVVPEIKQQFLIDSYDAVERGILPISKERIEQRLEVANFFLIDPTVASVNHQAGRFDSDENAVFIASHIVDAYRKVPEWEGKAKPSDSYPMKMFKPEVVDARYRKLAEDVRIKFRHTMYHEILHMLSGKTILSSYEEGGEDFKKFRHQKVGLSHRGKRVGRFTWLNEAVTDSLTFKLMRSEIKDGYGYAKELILYELLKNSGKVKISDTIFTEAYFENFDPNLGDEERLEYWKKLRLELAEAYDHDFILELDRCVQEKGIEAGIDLIKQKTQVP